MVWREWRLCVSTVPKKKMHSIYVQKTHLSNFTQMWAILSGQPVVVCLSLLFNLIDLPSSALIRQVNANCFHWLDVPVGDTSQRPFTEPHVANGLVSDRGQPTQQHIWHVWQPSWNSCYQTQLLSQQWCWAGTTTVMTRAAAVGERFSSNNKCLHVIQHTHTTCTSIFPRHNTFHSSLYEP